MKQEPNLYERIGGEEGIALLVDALYKRVMSDEELCHFFEHSPMDALQRMQREFIAAAVGGPIVYAGRPLREAHSGRGITKEHFQKFVHHALEALKAHNLSEEDAYDVISRLNTYVDDVIGDTVNG